MRTLPPIFLFAALLAAFPSPTAAADELPLPHKVVGEVFTSQTVRRVTGVSEVLGRGRLQVSNGTNKSTVKGGLLLFPSPRTGTPSDAAIRVQYLLGRTSTASKAREGYGTIRLASFEQVTALSSPRSHAFGDRAQTLRAVMWRGSDTEAYRAEGRLLKGRYVFFLWADGVRKRISAERLESIVVELMRLLATRLPVDGYADRPSADDDSSIGRSNQDLEITSIKVITPGKAGVIAHDRSIKVVARYEDPDGDDLLHRWQIHDAQGIKLYDGAGKPTRGGSTAICHVRRAGREPLRGPLTVTLRVQDRRGGGATKQIQVPVRTPVAELLGGFGDMHVTRKHKRMQQVVTTHLYEGDTITLYRDITWLVLSREERAALERQKEPLSFIDIAWPKYQAEARFILPASAPTLWTTIVIGRRPQHVTGIGDAIRYSIDQLFTLVYEKKRDDLFQAVIRRTAETVGPGARAVVAPLFAVAMAADATASDTVYVQLKSEIVIQGDGHGGLGMYTLEGAPTVIEANGRRRFTFPTGTWASIDEQGAHAKGAFRPGSIRSRWRDVDAHPVIRDPRRLMRMPASEHGGSAGWLVAGLVVGLIVLTVLGLVLVRRRSPRRHRAQRTPRARRRTGARHTPRPPPLPGAPRRRP